MQLSFEFYIVWSFEGNYKTTFCHMNCSLIKLASRQPQWWCWISSIFSNSPNTSMFLSTLLISCVPCQLKTFSYFNMTQCWNKILHRKKISKICFEKSKTMKFVKLVKTTTRNKHVYILYTWSKIIIKYLLCCVQI